MSFLQTAGIASQASDQFDRMRQQDRVAAQQEEGNQRALDSDKLFREIVKMAYEHELFKENQAAAKKPAPAKGAPGIAAPNVFAPGDGDLYAPQTPGYAAGGAVDLGELAYDTPAMAKGGRFNGIYDDTMVGDRMPTFYSEYGEGGGDHTLAVNDIVKSVMGMAEGGAVNGVPLYAQGGEVDDTDHTLWSFMKSRMGNRGMAGGGRISGPGTGTSDSIPGVIDGHKPVRVSSGEYILPEKMASAIGYDKLDAERQKYI